MGGSKEDLGERDGDEVEMGVAAGAMRIAS
jgi:hypothetical protein